MKLICCPVYCLCSILAEIGEENEKAKAKKQLKQPLTRAPRP